MNKKKPKFARQNAHRKKRVAKKGWRRPRGIDSKQRTGKKNQPKRPNIGYGTGKKKLEVLIHNINDFANLPKDADVKISATVGKKKKLQIIEKAKQLKIKILNA